MLDKSLGKLEKENNKMCIIVNAALFSHINAALFSHIYLYYIIFYDRIKMYIHYVFYNWRKLMSNELIKIDNEINNIFYNIKDLVINSRNKVYQTVNTQMPNLYRNIGKEIMEIQ